MNTKSIQHGVYGGSIGGAVFGALMTMMGMMPMIGRLVGQPTLVAGWLVHLGISAGIGVSFSLLPLGNARGRGAVAAGTVYGAVWWVLGPLTLMPLFLGMGLGVNWNATAARRTWRMWRMGRMERMPRMPWMRRDPGRVRQRSSRGALRTSATPVTPPSRMACSSTDATDHP